jgi:hypothetical protein
MSATNNNNAKTKVAMMDAASALALLGGPASDLILAESTPSSNSTSNERTIIAAGNHVLAFPKTVSHFLNGFCSRVYSHNTNSLMRSIHSNSVFITAH